jgi:hypothetical protein
VARVEEFAERRRVHRADHAAPTNYSFLHRGIFFQALALNLTPGLLILFFFDLIVL